MVRDLCFFSLCILKTCWIELPRSRIYSENRGHRLEKNNNNYLNSKAVTSRIWYCLAVCLGQVGQNDRQRSKEQLWRDATDIWQVTVRAGAGVHGVWLLQRFPKSSLPFYSGLTQQPEQSLKNTNEVKSAPCLESLLELIQSLYHVPARSGLPTTFHPASLAHWPLITFPL